MERGGRAVVRDVSVEIEAGQVTTLLGPNGAGKSTLVLAVGGVLRPKTGAVLLDEADIAGRRPERIRQAGVAIVPEGRRLLPDLTVEDNLRVASYALTGEQAQAGRDRVLELFPQLGQRLTALARTLSGGEQQMVVLAQALISQPRYLLIDELSLGLAPVVVSRLIPVIARGGRIGHRRAADRAVRHRRARPGPPRLHHGGRPDPLLRAGQRAARASRAAQLGLPAPRQFALRLRSIVRPMITICFAGLTGWTAPPILAAIDAADDLTLTSGVSRSAAGQGAVYATAAEALAAAPADVLVDFTSAAAVRVNAWAAVEAGVHVVIGTSGLTADDYAELDRLARDRGVGVIAAGNFSVMAAVLRRAATMAARHLGHWEIIDYASDTKPDVPSGTARDLAETLGQVREPGGAVPLAELEGPVEARGAEIGGARVHSVRLPSFVVSTEVVFGGPGERLIMRHDPGLTPAPYVAGTLLAVRRVADAVGVRRGLDSLLFG